MKPAAGIIYHKTLWPAACQATGQNPKDNMLRREVVMCCLDLAGVTPMTTSDPRWKDAHTTLLFTFLRHLAEPNNIELFQRWSDCKADYLAFHNSQLADWWQDQAYGQNGGRQLTRRRFQNRDRAHQHAFAPEPTLSRKEATDRLHTMRTRARRKYQLAA